MTNSRHLDKAKDPVRPSYQIFPTGKENGHLDKVNRHSDKGDGPSDKVNGHSDKAGLLRARTKKVCSALQTDFRCRGGCRSLRYIRGEGASPSQTHADKENDPVCGSYPIFPMGKENGHLDKVN